MIIKPPIRGQDERGAGFYGAPRGTRTHKGIDVACYAGSVLMSISGGILTKFGKPYYIENAMSDKDKAKNRLNYVQVTDDMGMNYRYFYVTPWPEIETGDTIKAGDIIGTVEDLLPIYKGITNHFHLEIKDDRGEYFDPILFI